MRDHCVPGLVLVALVSIGTASPSQAQNTLKTWKRGAYTTCGLRSVDGRTERFIAEELSGGISYDFSPTDAKWHEVSCDADPLAPKPTVAEMDAEMASIIARTEAAQARSKDCTLVRSNWAKMSAAERSEVLSIRARMRYEDGCGLKP